MSSAFPQHFSVLPLLFLDILLEIWEMCYWDSTPEKFAYNTELCAVVSPQEGREGGMHPEGPGQD